MKILSVKIASQIDTRLIVIDTTGVYSQIYDEIYCSKEDVSHYVAKYDSEKTGLCYVEIEYKN